MHANYVLQKMRSRKWSVVVLHFLSAFLSCHVILILSSLHGCSAGDTISIKNSLVDGETLVSAGNRFELGFFTPSGNSNVKRYVGIWYVFDPPTVVWVANRRKLLSDKTEVLHIADGYLKLTDKKGNLYWFTKYQYSRLSLVATLDDNGNLIMYANDGLGKSVWQSFDHPTDTFLYGMKMDENFVLTSWTSDKDPAPGNFTLKQEGKNQLVVEEQGITYWRSSRTASTNLIKFDDWPSTLDNFFNFSQNNTEVYRNDRMVMSYTGDLQYWRNWSLVWWEPKDKCSKYNFCGNFGSCNSNNKLPCKCLPGFKPKFLEKWNAVEYSDGCSRNSTSCGNDFLKLKRMKVGSGTSYEATDNKSCSEECLSRCQCQAYSFTINMDRTVSCLIWTDELRNLQEDREDGYDLYVRVAPSDIESTSRNCETCGTNLIPYPLSTGPNCADPMYYNFNCNNSKDQLRFMTDSGNYNVTSVDQEAHIFVIEVQAKEAVKCDALPSSGSKILQLNHSLPFYVTSNCSSDVYSPLNGTIEVKISWKPPLQPTCNSSADCKDWPYSSCDKRGIGQKRCHCNNTFYWDGLALNLPKQLGVCFNKSKTFRLILSVSLPIAMALLCTIVSIYLWRKKMKKAKQRKAHLHRYDTERGVKELMESNQLEGKDGTGIDVPFFDFAIILAATDNFSDDNRLGTGGFGPVYKGKFPGGKEIAIKRLASDSRQGLKEFKNEVVLIAKLQHRNLVRLLGYCITGDERILLYEYMPNKNESFSQQLDWETRFNIILGMARGLLYLHQDSRLRIIHRDMKTSNILLDEEMNPKISDSGLARMIQGKQTEGSTVRVVGTYGYMAPEYALDGLFSIKSDVFSFGVVMLEIISGKKNMRFYHVENTPSLISYAWRLWQEGNALDLMEETVQSSCEESEVLRCIQVGLLCVQEDPGERPTMSDVVVMLGSETTSLPIPNQPAFLTRMTPLSATASTSSKLETNNEITASLEEGR